MWVLIDKRTDRIIEPQDAIEIVDSFWVKSNHGSLIQLDMIDLVEVDLVPKNAEYYKDNTFYNKHPNEVIAEKEEIKKQLEDIDKKSVRDSEDLIELLVKKGIISLNDLPFVKSRKEQKQALRNKL